MPRTIPADIEQTRFDVVVIGAGINGVAIARDAAVRGLRVLVLDKGDIGGGTTSWSTRLIHGGLRYLEHFEFGLVRESLRERELLLRNAPHLVTPIPMILPIYGDARRGPALIRAGMVLYDLLSYDKSLERHHVLNPRQTLQRAPGLRSSGLKAGARYFDAQATFAERMAVENALSAREHGAEIVTYARADKLATDGAVVRGVTFTDLLTGTELTAQARWVINVAGPWVDAVLTRAPAGTVRRSFIGGTKGSHLVVRPFPGAPPADALYYEAKSDGRAVFIVPWNGFYLIGSTDIRYTGDLDDVRASEEEIAYLIDETNALLPTAGLTRDDVLYTYCGVRPLPAKTEGKEGAITRKHIIHNHEPAIRGLISIVGGKLTTHRSLAEETVDAVMAELGRDGACRTAQIALPGAAGIALEPFRARLVADAGLPAATVDRLVDIYGVKAEEIAASARATPALAESFDDETGAIAAELVYAAEREQAEMLGDLLLRRTMVGLASHAGVGPDERAAAIARQQLGWSAERAAREVAEYRRYVERFTPKALETATGRAHPG